MQRLYLQAFLLVYDVTDKASFERLQYWLDFLGEVIRVYCTIPCEAGLLLAVSTVLLSLLCFQYGADEDSVIVLLANKADETDRKKVSDMAGAAFALQHKLPFFLTSARTDAGVTDVSRDTPRTTGLSVYSA